MRPWQLLMAIMLLSLVTGCAGTGKQPSYLQEYGSQGGRGQGFRAAPYLATDEVHECVVGEVSGRINRLRVETFAPGLEPGLALEIQTPDRGLVHVHCGPLRLLDCQESDLKPGDYITMKVFCHQLGEGQESLFASEIIHGDHTFSLRDAQGNPYWGVCRKK